MTGPAVGDQMMALVERLYPICRSITGNGVRETLEIIGELVPLQVHEVPSGTEVLDWVIPHEWNITDAWIADASGQRVVDFRKSNLHVMSYSVPVGPKRVSLEELRGHLHSLPEHPDWVPYRTSYYEPEWGFCLPHAQRVALGDPEYEVCVRSTLEPGYLTYGEYALPGESEEEILISVHVCHPSLCNDNLSGIAVSAFLARALASRSRRLSYRFLFVPGTIGSIAWLAGNRDRVDRIRGGLTLVCLGDPNGFTYKRTLAGDREIDRAADHVVSRNGGSVIDFFPYGYDERQFNSPGFRIPVGSLMRGRHGQFPEYHTSADDLSLVSGERLAESLDTVRSIVDVMEGDRRYRNTAPHGEPQLGRRGIYRAIGGGSDPAALQMAMLWVLSLSDGGPSLVGVAERSGLPFATVREAADLLLRHELLEEAP